MKYMAPVMQRRSQVSLTGGADRIPGGGINLNTYSYGKGDRQPRGGSNFSRGGWAPLAPPPWLRACHDGSPHGSRDGFPHGSRDGSPHGSRDGSPVSSVISSASDQPQGKKKTKKTGAKKTRAKKTDNSLSPANEGMLEFIVENPMLWDKRLNDYRNPSKKAKVWEEQATQMGKDGKKKLWQIVQIYFYVDFYQ